MKVRATRLGYYGDKRRRPGDEFVISGPDHYSFRWMEKVESAKPPKKKATKKSEDKEVVQDSNSEVI